MTKWLPITEYSIKTGVSISTIRRKIKTKVLKHRIENGKYLISDENTDYEISLDKNKVAPSFSNIEDLICFAETSINKISELNKSVIEEKDRLIKMQEDHILKLKEQVDELKMLVSVLEKRPIN
jgi:hypothetical protein